MGTIITRERRGIGQKIALTLHKYLAVLRVSAANNLAYLSEVFFRAMFLLVFIFVFLQLWTVTYAGKGVHALGGYTINGIIWYVAVTEIIALSLPPLTRQIDQEVRSGQIAYLLGRPCNYVLYRFAQYLGERMVRLAINIPAATILAWLFVGPPPISLFSVLAWLPTLLLALCIDYLVYVAIGLLAFWTEDTTPFFFVINRLALILGGVLAPLAVLPQPIRGIAEILPFSAVFYDPASTLVHFDVSAFGAALLQQTLTLAVVGAFLFVMYTLATRRVSINGG
jgi:ABC-2 type transport system permease protein